MPRSLGAITCMHTVLALCTTVEAVDRSPTIGSMRKNLRFADVALKRLKRSVRPLGTRGVPAGSCTSQCKSDANLLSRRINSPVPKSCWRCLFNGLRNTLSLRSVTIYLGLSYLARYLTVAFNSFTESPYDRWIDVQLHPFVPMVEHIGCTIYGQT